MARGESLSTGAQRDWRGSREVGYLLAPPAHDLLTAHWLELASGFHGPAHPFTLPAPPRYPRPSPHPRPRPGQSLGARVPAYHASVVALATF